MTQEKALVEYQAMFPNKADKLAVERKRSIGYKFGHANGFNLWDHSDDKIQLTSSNISWEHVLMQVRAKHEELWSKDTSPIAEDEALEVA